MDNQDILTENVQPQPATSVFNGRHTISGSLGVALILFFLPFFNINCNGMKVASATGVQIALGFEIKMDKTFSVFDEKTTTEDQAGSMKRNPNKRKPNYMMLTALVMTGLGFGASFFKFSGKWRSITIAAGFAAVGMIGTFIQFLTERPDMGKDPQVRITIDATLWFYTALAVLIFATVKSYQRSRVAEE